MSDEARPDLEALEARVTKLEERDERVTRLEERVENLGKLEGRVENLARMIRQQGLDMSQNGARLTELKESVERAGEAFATAVDELRLAKRGHEAAEEKASDGMLTEIKLIREDARAVRDQYNRAANALSARVGTLEEAVGGMRKQMTQLLGAVRRGFDGRLAKKGGRA